MKRIWQVEEQTIEDPSTKLRLEFSSVHTDEVNTGNEAPARDETVVLRLWTSDRTRLATFVFERNGKFVNAEVESVSGFQTERVRDRVPDVEDAATCRDGADP